MSDYHQQLKQQLDQAINLAQQQLNAAKAGEWQQVETLEQQRQALLQTCFKKPVEPNSAPLAKLGIETLQDLEEQLRLLLVKDKSKTTQQLQQLKKGNRANKAYQQHR